MHPRCGVRRGPAGFKAAEIVGDDDVPALRGEGEGMANPGGEEYPIDVSIDDTRCNDAVGPEPGEESQRLPFSCGILASSGVPQVLQPRVGAMFVLTEISSMKTSRDGSTRFS